MSSHDAPGVGPINRPVVEPSALTRPFWDAAKDGRLVMQRCAACGHHQHYPRALCTSCASTDLAFVEVSGKGAVYSSTVVHRAAHPALEPPYVVALVRLVEGPVLLTNIVGCHTSDVGCDMRVQVVWEDLGDGRRLPLFEPDES
jgi:uncharacterized OB-fold protein